MRFEIKRRLLVAVVLASLLLLGTSQAITPAVSFRSQAALYLLSQYKALTGDGDGAVEALLAATEQPPACTASASLPAESMARVTQSRVECRLGRISKRT